MADTKAVRERLALANRHRVRMGEVVDTALSLCDEVDRLSARVQKLETSLREIRGEVSCRCDEGFTSRGRHEPNSLCHLAEAIDEDLKP